MLAFNVVQDFKNGDTDAFNIIYDYHAEAMWALCFKYTKSREVTEELVNDIFIRIWNNRELIDPEQGVKNYLYATARNILHNWFVSVSRNKRMKKVFEVEFFSQQKEWVESSMDAKIDLKALKVILNNLPPRRREIYELCKFEGKSYAELAAYFSITRDAVKDHIVKTNKMLVHLNKERPFYIFWLFFYYIFYSL